MSSGTTFRQKYWNLLLPAKSINDWASPMTLPTGDHGSHAQEFSHGCAAFAVTQNPHTKTVFRFATTKTMLSFCTFNYIKPNVVCESHAENTFQDSARTHDNMDGYVSCHGGFTWDFTPMMPPPQVRRDASEASLKEDFTDSTILEKSCLSCTSRTRHTWSMIIHFNLMKILARSQPPSKNVVTAKTRRSCKHTLNAMPGFEWFAS